jgi:hypothetical protein
MVFQHSGAQDFDLVGGGRPRPPPLRAPRRCTSSKLQRRMTAGPREALARAAPAPDLYNPQAMASVGADDLVIDAVGTLRGGAGGDLRRGA